MVTVVTVRKQQQQALECNVQRYQQGGRIAYALVMDLGTLDSNIPNFVNPDRIDKANRRFNPTHSRHIADYLYEVDDWVLGAILLGIDPDVVEYVPYPDDAGQPSATLGYIRIPLDGGTGSIKILDGQHRRMAIQRVRARLRREIRAGRSLASTNGDAVRLQQLQRKSARLDEMSIPVVLYEEADTKNLRRMFADLAQTHNIDAPTKARFDDRDPFNRAAVEMVELRRSALLADRVEMERATPGHNSNHLLAINQLARCLKVLKYGYGARANRDRIREVQGNYDALIDMGIDWADDFLPSARAEYEVLHSIELDEHHVADNRARYVAYSATCLQLLAGCLHEWHKRRLPWNELADWLRSADFDLASDDCIFRKSGMLIPGDTSLVSRSQNVKATIKYIVDHASGNVQQRLW